MTRTDRRRQGRRGPAPQLRAGFTLVELTMVLVVMGVLAAIILTRTTSMDPTLASRASELRSQIRYVQLRAMKSGTDYCGMKSDGTTAYWAFNSTTPDTAAAQIALPGEASRQVSLAAKGIISMTPFTLYFDTFGIPYSGASPAKLTAPLSITIVVGGSNATLTVTPETGFVP